MKIDEDLIFEQYENIRNELVKYINETMTQKERNDHGQNLVEIAMPWRGLISTLKIEQMERDSDQDTEFKFLNDERMKYFDY